VPSLLHPSAEDALADSVVLSHIPDALLPQPQDMGRFRRRTPREFGGSETSLTDVTPPIDQPARIGRTHYRGSFPLLEHIGCPAVSLGIAHNAIDEMTTPASTKLALAGATARSTQILYVIAKSEAAVHAARSLLSSAAQVLQSAGEFRNVEMPDLRALLRSVMTHVADVSLVALEAMYELASSSWLDWSSRLERPFPDGMHGGRARKPVHRVHRGCRPRAPRRLPRAGSLLMALRLVPDTVEMEDTITRFDAAYEALLAESFVND
jgi:hypothetical protein